MSNFEKQLMKIINKNNNTQLNNFITKKVYSKLFQSNNRKELIRLLPTIISNTTNNNCNWLDITYNMSKTENFLNTLIDNIDKFNFQDNDFLLYKTISQFLTIKLTKPQLEKLVDKILTCNCKITITTLNTIHSIIKENEPLLINSTLIKFLTNEKTCQNTIYFILRHSIYIDLIYQNIDIILTNSNSIDLFNLKNATKENLEITNKIKEKIEENKKNSINTTLKNLYPNFIDKNIIIDNKNLETINEIIYLILNDISKNEQVNLSQLEILGNGAYSYVLELGNKIIKIGSKRGTKTFNNNPYVNAILLRKEFPIDKNTSLFIEVNEKLDTKSYISDEELYQLYKKIRNINLIWVDVAKRNVGRLLKDNKIYWHQELPINDEILGLNPYKGNDQLKKGDIIIIDNDLIFDENDDINSINEYSNPLQKKFEYRYQTEKNKKR